MSAAAHVMPLGPILREADARVKDKSYRRSPVGQHVGRFLRAYRWEAKSAATLDSYETTLARLSNDHDDYANGLADFCTPVGTEYLRDFLDRHWADSSPATRANRLAAVKSLFRWATGERLIEWDPAATIRSPGRGRTQERQAYPQDVIHRLVAAQPGLRDQCAIQLVARLGLRKNELRLLTVGEIDLVRNLITVHGKGATVSVMPIGYPSLAEDLYLHVQGDGRQTDEYLLYPRSRKRDPMDKASVHRWFKRCLKNAALPTTVKLHEMRHTAADHVYRQTGDIVRASQLLRHSSVVTTQTYLHPTRRDLADALAEIDKGWGS